MQNKTGQFRFSQRYRPSFTIFSTLLYHGHLGFLISLSLFRFNCKLDVIIDYGSAFVTRVERGPVSRPRLIGAANLQSPVTGTQD